MDEVTLSHRTIDSPFGPLLLVATDRGMVRLAFEHDGFDEVLDRVAEQLGARAGHDQRHLVAAAGQIDEYLGGTRRAFELDLDRSLSHGFRGEVHRYVDGVPYGETVSYKQVAEDLGNPGATRAVGTACGANPMPILVACHRVLRSDGTLSGYAGGRDMKLALLAMESGERDSVA